MFGFAVWFTNYLQDYFKHTQTALAHVDYHLLYIVFLKFQDRACEEKHIEHT